MRKVLSPKSHSLHLYRYAMYRKQREGYEEYKGCAVYEERLADD